MHPVSNKSDNSTSSTSDLLRSMAQDIHALREQAAKDSKRSNKTSKDIRLLKDQMYAFGKIICKPLSALLASFDVDFTLMP